MPNFHSLNAIVIALFITLFLPTALRDSKSGTIRKFTDPKVLLQLALLVVIESYLLIYNLGLSQSTIVRIVFSVLLTIAGALLFIKFTHKQLFGQNVKISKWW